jgi:hypothetical protein
MAELTLSMMEYPLTVSLSSYHESFSDLCLSCLNSAVRMI